MECEIRRVAPEEWGAFRDVRLAALAEAPYAFAATLDTETGYDERRWRERVSRSASVQMRASIRPGSVTSPLDDR